MSLIKRGDKGNTVLNLQSRLFDLGFDIAVDGVFGPKTEDAVISFQTSNNLQPDGIVGEATWSAIANITDKADSDQILSPEDEPNLDSDLNGSQLQFGINGSKPNRVVVFPSGAVFQEFDQSQDEIDYADHVAKGEIPLIKVMGREKEKLSDNFTVREFMCRDGAPYARISPYLVSNIQQLRTQLGMAVTVNSGYRHPAYNKKQDGKPNSQHITGRAADLRVLGMAQIDLAKHILVVFGCDVGIGLYNSFIHIDMRGRRATWGESAGMTKKEFKDWVTTQCGSF